MSVATVVDGVFASVDLATDTPEILIDIGVVRANIHRAAELGRVAGVSIRPHIKTHKMPQIAQIQVEEGAVGIQVAKLGEAEVMVDYGLADVLVGYPIVGPVKLRRLVALAERVRISVALDSLVVATGISESATSAGVTIGVLIELDTGMQRLGVAPGVEAANLAEQVAELPGLELLGVFSHEGHVYTAALDDDDRRRMTAESCALTVETAELVRERGIPAPTVSVGSAGTFRFAIECPGVTEVRPGTYVFNDRTQIAQGAAAAANLAAAVITTVVSRPSSDRVVVDAGSKVLSSDRLIIGAPPQSFGTVLGHDDWNVERLSEEHGVVTVPAGAEVAVGDRLAIIPNHICPVIGLTNTVTVVENGVFVDRWPVAGRGKVQ